MFTLFIYLLFSFWQADILFWNWPEYVRFFFAFIAFFAVIFDVCVIFIGYQAEKEERKLKKYQNSD
jgi:hypothetical protein